jgi:leucyl aminopeptidase
MEIKVINSNNKNINNDLELVVLQNLKIIDKKISKKLKKIGFEGKESQECFFENKLYIGVTSLKKEDLKIAFANAIRSIQKTKFKNILINLLGEKELNIKDLTEGLILGAYSFQDYKSEKKESKINIFIDVKGSKKTLEELKKDFEETKKICDSVNMVRTIVNTTPEDFYPKSFSEKAKEIALKNNLECKIYGEEYLLDNGMNAMLAVGRASRHESQLVHLTYKPKKAKAKVVIVGKGLTYDAGGLSLKQDMVSMKCDKSGGSAVLGILEAVSKLKLDVEVHGIIGAVENMIGGDAYKPDDILKAKNGVTIEVTNTDAEGRLVLADCLCYAQDEIEDIDSIFDVATLTGACIVALGEYTTGVMGHSEKMKKQIQKASNKSGELVGFLPYNRYLPEMLKSSIADVVNSPGSRAGSSITASLFLDKFIKKENKNKWLHLDIAGAAYREKVWGYNNFGGTGASVRLLVEYIKKIG